MSLSLLLLAVEVVLVHYISSLFKYWLCNLPDYPTTIDFFLPFSCHISTLDNEF